jgi:hypothetical protein
MRGTPAMLHRTVKPGLTRNATARRNGDAPAGSIELGGEEDTGDPLPTGADVTGENMDQGGARF